MDKHSLRNVRKNKKYFIEHEIESAIKKQIEKMHPTENHQFQEKLVYFDINYF